MARLRINAFLFLLAGYLVLGYSFMLLRFPPTGAGIPIGELFLVFFLLTTNLPRTISRLGDAIPILPLLLFWGLASTRLAVGIIENGTWAFRDASHFIDSLYLIVGFSLAAKEENWQRLWRWLPWILAFAALYAFTFLIRDEVAAFGPTISGASGQEVPVLGTFAASANMLLFAAVYLMAYRSRKFRGADLAAIACVAFGVLVFQARTIYFQILALALLFAIYRRKTLPRLLAVVPVLAAAVGAIVLLDIKVPGRLSEQISFSFFIEHFGASFGMATSRDLIGAASGVDLRLNWWRDIFDQLWSTPISALTGLGYGIPLTHFVNAERVLVREPHNSIISILSRLGVFGIASFLGVSAVLTKAALESMRASITHRWSLWEDRLLVFFGYFLLTFVMAITEDAFEKPYLTIPYYAFWGFVLRFRYEARRSISAEKGRDKLAQSPNPREAVAGSL